MTVVVKNEYPISFLVLDRSPQDGARLATILAQEMADELGFLWSQGQNCIAEADADLIFLSQANCQTNVKF